MRVLHLSPELPYAPGGNGGQTREFHILRRLVERGHEVTALAPVTSAQAPFAHLLEEAGVRVIGIPRPEPPVREVARAVLRAPAVAPALLTRPWLAWQMRVFWTLIGPRALEEVAAWRPDVAVVDHDMSVRWATSLPAELPAVLVCQNLTWNYYRSRARAGRGPARAAYALEAHRYRTHVLRALPRYHAAITVSTVEQAELERLAPGKSRLIPSGVDLDALRPLREPPVDGPPRLLFTGSMWYRPNAEGIAWFVDHVWPLIRARAPEALLDVVGRDPGPEVTALGRVEGVTVTGAVPDMAPYFDRATIVVVPILTGAGIRIKILEALAAGRAVVSTAAGAEGLEVEPGRHLLVSDAPEAFADAAVGLLSDAQLRERLTAEGRTLAERRYDWRVLGDEVAALLAEAAR